MAKRIFSFLLATLLVLSSFATISFAATATITVAYDEETQTLTLSGEGAMPAYNSSLSDAPYADYKTTAKKVIVSEGITTVGNNAFCGMTALETVELPDGITSIGSSAFKDSTITSIDIPSTVTSIGGNAFYNIKTLTSIVIPEGVTTLGSSIFRNSSNLTYIYLPSTITTIPADTFRSCTNLATVDMYPTVTTIASGAFRACSNLETVNYFGSEEQKAVTVAGTESSYNSSTILEATFNLTFGGAYNENTKVLTVYGAGAMPNYSNTAANTPWYDHIGTIEKVIIKDGITSIGNNAFKGFTAITEIDIPQSVTKIGSAAFQNCTSLKKADLPENLTSLGQYSYYATVIESIVIPEAVTVINHSTFRNCTVLSEVTFKGKVTEFGQNSFYNTKALKKMEIPSSLTTVVQSAFNGAGLSEIVYNGSPADFAKITVGISNEKFLNAKITYLYNPWEVTDGVLTINENLGNFSSKNTPWYENADEITKVVVAEGVTALGDWALSYLKNVEAVELPESLKTIGKNAFYRNEKLTEITIPEGVTEIENGAFAYCYNLKTINLPSTIQKIGKLAFVDCNSLETVNYAGTLDMWNNVSIGTGNEALTDCYPPSTVEKVFEWNVTDGVLTISGNVKMEDYASKAAPWFDKADEITKVVIEDGIKSIGANAFAYLRNLEEVEIADTVTSIGGYAFYGCTLLKEVDIPDNVTYLGSAAFAYCKSLKKVTVPANVKTLYKYTFIDNYVLRTAIYEGDFATLTVLVGNDDFVNANRVEIPEAKVNNLGEVTVPVAGEEYTLETAYCFTPTEKFEDVNANSEYKYYHADFVVTFDKDITDVALAGYYKEYALAVNSADWVPMILQNKKAGEETRLLRDMWFGTDGSISYQELCMIEKFLCGALDLNDNDTGVKMTVELRLYEVTENAPQTDVETGEYVTVGSYTYTF